MAPNSEATKKLQACSSKQARAAEIVVGTAHSWKELYEHYKRFQHCDDGAIAESFSESVSMLLDERWKEINTLSRIAKTNAQFRTFILRHVDETILSDRLGHISSNATNHCPPNIRSLCSEISNAAQLAIERIEGK